MEHTKESVTKYLQMFFYKLDKVMGTTETGNVMQEINQFIENLDINLQEYADNEFKEYANNLLASLQKKLSQIESNENTKNLSEKLTGLQDVVNQM